MTALTLEKLETSCLAPRPQSVKHQNA